MIDVLAKLYDRRLKARLCYQDSLFTYELVEYMFKRFDEIAVNGQPLFSQSMCLFISDILDYHQSEENQAKATVALYEIITNLENYIKCTLLHFWPDMVKELGDFNKDSVNAREDDNGQPEKNFDYRAFIGLQFKNKVEECPSRFPAKLSRKNIIAQLRHVTEIRNKTAHRQNMGYTVMFNRYHYLKAFDVLLGYLLYTFYHMIFAECEDNYLKKESL